MFGRINCDIDFITNILEEDLFLHNGITKNLVLGWALMFYQNTQGSKCDKIMMFMNTPTIAIKTEIKVRTALTVESISLNRADLTVLTFNAKMTVFGK